MRPAIHVALEHLQTVDVPFHGAATPGQGDACFDCRIVALETFRYALKRGQRACCRLLQPRIEPIRLPDTEDLRNAVGEHDRLREGGMHVVHLGKQHLLALCHVLGLA